MIEMPTSEQLRFDKLIRGHAIRFGLSPEDYIRKIWYHETASVFGEYVALRLVDELTRLAPPINSTN